MDILTNIKIGASVVLVTIASLLGYTPTTQAPILGASYQTPDVRALFSTTLASRISATDTSMTLTSATDKDGNVLSSSTYGFIIDEGTSVEEFVLADCTGTVCTNMTRGLSVLTGTTTVSSLRFEHRRGASVKITTAPILLFLNNVVQGRQNLENKLRYDSALTFDNSRDIIDKGYADALSFGAVPEASETAAGFGEIATKFEAASSTTDGSVARLVLPASIASSTYNAGSSYVIPVTGSDNKLDDDFIPDIINHSLTIVGTTTISGSGTLVDSNNVRLFKFGGTGADGALTVSSGTTNIDLGGAQLVIKNYTSISITGTGKVTFSNPHANGTTIIWKSQGDVTLTSSEAPMLDASGMGANSDTDGYSVSLFKTNKGSMGSGTTPGVGGAVPVLSVNTSVRNIIAYKYPLIGVGAGGGTGATDNRTNGGGGASVINAGENGTGGTNIGGGTLNPGGRGGGSLVIECGGSFNFTTSSGISVAGKVGGSTTSGTTGVSGGGGGGVFVVFYNTLTANSGTVTVSGGAGGSGANGAKGGAGGAGYSLIAQNTEF